MWFHYLPILFRANRARKISRRVCGVGDQGRRVKPDSAEGNLIRNARVGGIRGTSSKKGTDHFVKPDSAEGNLVRIGCRDCIRNGGLLLHFGRRRREGCRRAGDRLVVLQTFGIIGREEDFYGAHARFRSGGRDGDVAGRRDLLSVIGRGHADRFRISRRYVGRTSGRKQRERHGRQQCNERKENEFPHHLPPCKMLLSISKITELKRLSGLLLPPRATLHQPIQNPMSQSPKYINTSSFLCKASCFV